MATVKIDSVLVGFVTKILETEKSGNTISGYITTSIGFFLNKHPKCLSCDFHRDMIIGLEVGRQELALKKLGQEPKPQKGRWVVIKKETLDRIKNFSAHYRSSMRESVEQAVLESVTRTANCGTCPYFSEMKKNLEKSNGDPSTEQTEVCSPSPSHRTQSDGCSGERPKTGGICEGTGVQNPDGDRPRDD